MFERRFLFLLMLTLVAVAAAPAQAKEGSDDPKWCRACHTSSVLSEESMAGGVHADLSCRDCHQGYHFNPHEKVEVVDTDETKAFKKLGYRSPVAMAACTECHDTLSDVPGFSAHGRATDPSDALPYCLDCHGDPHTIKAMGSLTANERKLAQNERCLGCHDNAVKMEGTGLSTDIRAPYQHTVHARKLALGDDKAPGCVDCHGGHETLTGDAEVESTCGKCHEDANSTFLSISGHPPHTKQAHPISYWTLKFFAVLTFATILALILHVLLDLLATIRAAIRTRTKEEEEEERKKFGEKGLNPHKEVQRFDLHQRLQHFIMIASFITLVLTGWPISTSGIGVSHGLVAALGGLGVVALLHRIAGIGLIVTSVYHLCYLGFLFATKRKAMPLSMLPAPKDVKDVIHNVLFFFGLEKDRPRYCRFSYFEKFDYWAVFWGVVIMVGSGLIRWFPVITTKVAPAWVYEIAYIAHADEAILAALAIFVWHFYNVHLRPAVFPMSWVFIHGRMSMEEMDLEHGAVFDKMLAENVAKLSVEADNVAIDADVSEDEEEIASSDEDNDGEPQSGDSDSDDIDDADRAS